MLDKADNLSKFEECTARFYAQLSFAADCNNLVKLELNCTIDNSETTCTLNKGFRGYRDLSFDDINIDDIKDLAVNPNGDITIKRSDYDYRSKIAGQVLEYSNDELRTPQTIYLQPTSFILNLEENEITQERSPKCRLDLCEY